MDNAELVHYQQTIQALNSHTSKLDAMKNSDPHASCGLIKAIKSAQHYDIKAL